MATKLTDKQKKKIVADYLETQSINAAAKKNGVSWCAAKAALDEVGEIEKKLEQKRRKYSRYSCIHGKPEANSLRNYQQRADAC